MIASDRVLLDGLIHQWEERAGALFRLAGRVDGNYRDFARGEALMDCTRELRAALLVLGDARPHLQEP